MEKLPRQVAGVCDEENRGQKEEPKDYGGRSGQKQHTLQCRENMMLRTAENCKDRVRIAAGAGSFSQKCCQKDSTLYEEETSSLMGELQTLQLNSKAYAMKCRIALAP